MTVADHMNDISPELALSAYSGVSFFPEKRAERARAEYVETLSAVYAELAKHATTDETCATLETEFERFAQGFHKRYTAFLASQSRIVSSAIAGPSNFPTRRMQKRNMVADKRLAELLRFQEDAKAAILRALHPELRPIMSGDDDAVERLEAKIAQAEKEHVAMKAANAAIRKHAKGGAERQVEALIALGFPESQAHQLLRPDFCGRIGFPDYAISNHGANIRRMKERLESVGRNKQASETKVAGSNARFEDCPADNRVRLFFPGKPDESTRSDLKRSGFRWSPTIGAWQAYRHSWTIAKAKEVAGVADVA